MIKPRDYTSQENIIAKCLDEYGLRYDQQVEFLPAKDFSKKKVVVVATKIIELGREPIDISFRVRKNRKTNEWKAYDMVAEGVSLLDAKKSELASLICQKGLPYVTQLLKVKSLEKVVFKKL